MSTDAARPIGACSSEQLRHARQVLELESQAIADVAGRLDSSFCEAAECLHLCRGNVVVTGMGKAGFIGQKISATLASTGTPSHWLHPAEAVHGDLGRVRALDVVMVLSQSGETDEVVRLLPWLRELGVPLVAITAEAGSTLGRAATIVIALGQIAEACPLGLAPSTSTTAMLAVGDALALEVSRMRGFTRDDFARFHPAGSLGRKLSRVEQQMRPREQCRIASDDLSIRDVFVTLSVPGRRTGAIMLVDSSGTLSGIFTDSDLARLFERRRECDLDGPIRSVMTSRPLTIPVGSLLVDAVAIMARRKISELPVVDAEGHPAGLIDITDVVGALPNPGEPSEATDQPRAAPATRSDLGRPGWRIYREPQ
jgi:arabinose-5-phosphate isomerase